MRMIFVGGDGPLPGGGQQWKAIEGGPAYRRLVDVPGGGPLDTSAWTAGEAIWTGQQVFPFSDLASPGGAGALLAVCQEPIEGAEGEFKAWMDQEHVPGLAAVPGVLAARRFEAISGTPRFFAVYHLASADVMAQDAWKKVGGSEWTQRMRPLTRGRVRAVYVPA
jgi:hypothetical protein